MARATFVKAARKDNPVAKKGEPYYWFKFAFGPKQFSKTMPKASQLTQSEFLSTLYSIQEEIGELVFTDLDNGQEADDLSAMVEDWQTRIEELGDMSQESLDNMPEALQEGDTGQMLQARVEAMEEAHTALDEFTSLDSDDRDDGETVAMWGDRMVEEIQGVSIEEGY